MKNATRNLVTILLPAVLTGAPITVAADGAAMLPEDRIRAERLQEIRSNIRMSLVPSVEEKTDGYANRRTPDNSQGPDHGRRGVIEIIPFPQKRVSFTP